MPPRRNAGCWFERGNGIAKPPCVGWLTTRFLADTLSCAWRDEHVSLVHAVVPESPAQIMPRTLRRFFQFSVRTLFALMVVVAVLFAWLHYRNERRWRHEESILEGEWECVEWNAADPLFTFTLKDGIYSWRVPGSTTPVVGQYAINPFEEP